MKTYENLLLPVDEWIITSTMSLDDNGCFRYQELWSCYLGSTNSKAEGKWKQTGGVVVFETEQTEGAPRLAFVEGQKLQASKRDDCLDFGNDFIMSECS